MADRTIEVKYSVDTAAEGKAQVEALSQEIKNLGGSAEETKKEAEQLAETLRKQEDTKAGIQAFQTLGGEIEKLGGKYENAKDKSDALALRVKALTEQFTAAGTVTEKEAAQLQNLTARQESAQRQTERLNATLQSKRAALQEVTGSLERAGIDTKGLGDAEQRLGGDIAVTRRALNEQIEALVRTRSELDGTASTATRTDGVFASFKQQLLGFAGGILSLQAVKAAITSVIEAGSKLEGLKDSLGDVFGSVQKGEQAFASLEQLGENVPESIEQITEAAVRLKRSGLDPLDGSLQALIDENSSLGRSNEDLAALIDKVSDAYAKGKLEQRDIVALQKEGVPVIELLSKATGKSAEELEKLAANGLLGRDAIRQLIEQMGKGAFGAAAGDMDQLATVTAKAKDKLQDFLAKVADSGPLEFFKRQLKGASDELGSSGEAAKGFGETITVVFGALSLAAEVVRSSFNVVTAAARTFYAGMLDIAADIQSGFAKISFGKLSETFQKAADETRLIADGLRQDAVEDLNDIGDTGRQMGKTISDGLDALAQSSSQAATAQGQLAQRVQQTGAAAATASQQQATAAEEAHVAAAKQIVDLATILAKADELGKSYQNLLEQGKSAAESISTLFQTADQKTPGGILALEVALKDIAGASAKSAQALREGLAGELKKLTDDDLLAFQQRVQQALSSVQGLAVQGSTLLKELLREELRRIGTDLEELDTRVDASTRKLLDSFTAIASNAAASGEAVGIAFKKALDSADTREELELLKKSLAGVKTEGFDTGKAIQEVTARIKDLGSAGKNLSEINQAFAELGLTSRESLEIAKEKAIEAFNVIRSDGTLAAGDVDRAFGAMANKVLEAAAASGRFALSNAEAMLRAQETTAGQSRAIDDLIKKYEASGDAAQVAGEKAAKASDDAAAAAKRQADAIQRVNDETDASHQAFVVDRNAGIGGQVVSEHFDQLDPISKDRIQKLINELTGYAASHSVVSEGVQNSIIDQIKRIDQEAYQRILDAQRSSASSPATLPQPPTPPLSLQQPAGGINLKVTFQMDSRDVARLVLTEGTIRDLVIPVLGRISALNR